MKNPLLLCLILAALVCGCKKYEDGPLISFRSAKQRILGAHTLTKYTVDGVDCLSSYNDSLGLSYYFYYDKANNKNICMADGFRKDGKGAMLEWIWELKKNNTILEVTTSICSVNMGPFSSYVTPHWVILKLKNDDIKLRSDYGGVEYIIELQ